MAKNCEMELNGVDDSREGIGKYLKRSPRACFAADDEDEDVIVGVIISGHDGRHDLLHPCLRDADLYDSSCSEQARIVRLSRILTS